MNFGDALGIVFAASVGAALFVLPGLGVRELARMRRRAPLDELLVGVGTGTITIAAIGTILVGTRSFSPLTIAIPLLPLGALGLRRAVFIVRRVLPSPVSLVLAVYTIPWWWSSLRAGAPPSPLFQWYYWNLGRALGETNGVPSFVSEYGTHIRWLPDYFVFNLHSELYRGLSGIAGRTNPIVAFRIPVAALAIIAIFGVLRMWLPAWAALLGTGLAVESAWFLDKFNAYKPEAVGVVIGLIAVRLGIRAVRSRDWSLLIFVGLLFGVDLAIHPIAATVTGLLLGGSIIAELSTTSELRIRRTIVSIGIAAMLALMISAALGWSVQGRVSVIGDAANPHRLADGTDPTLVFAQRDAGNFGPVTEPKLADELSGYVSEPWPGLRLDTGTGVAFGGFIGVGLVLAFTGGGGLRKATIALAAFALLLVIGILYFSSQFDTYVPRHTGLARFAQYGPLVCSLATAVAAAAIVRVLTRITLPHAPRTRRRIGATAGVILIMIIVINSGRTAIDAYRPQLSLSTEALGLLDDLAHDAHSGDVVLTNSTTRGLVEFWTHAEDPLEARQALIEPPAFLSRATRTLEEAHAFFTGTGSADFAERIHATWIVITPSPDRIGAAISLGIPPAGWAVPGYTRTLETAAVTVFHRDRSAGFTASSGAAKDRAIQAWLATLAAFGFTAGALGLLAPGARRRISNRFAARSSSHDGRRVRAG